MAAEDTVVDAVEPLLHTVGTSILNPNPMEELGFCLVIMVIMISVHGWCVGSVSHRFATSLANMPRSTPGWKISLLVSMTIGFLAVVHLLETLIWVVPIWWLGLVPSLRETYLYVLEAYTTLGKGQVSLPENWRLVGPMVAISGLFTFSWTGSVLVYVMSESSKRHAQRAHARLAAQTGAKTKDATLDDVDGSAP